HRAGNCRVPSPLRGQAVGRPAQPASPLVPERPPMKLPIVSPDPYVEGQRLLAWARANTLVQRAYERAMGNRYTKEILADPMFMADATVEAPPPEPTTQPAQAQSGVPAPDIITSVVGGLIGGPQRG